MTVAELDPTRPSYPPAHRLDLVDALHGRPVPDPYRWLEDPQDPRTVDWSAAQDELFADYQASWPARDVLRGRLAELFATGEVSVPIWRGSRPFLRRRRADQEHGVVLTVDPDGTERVLLDPVEIDPSGTTTLDGWAPSQTGNLLAYLLSSGGTEMSTMWVKDVLTGAIVDGPVDRMRYSPLAWLPKDEGLYLVRHLAAEVAGEDALLHRRVYLHRLGGDPDSDVLIFGEGYEKGHYFGVGVSADGRWLTLSSSKGTDPRNDAWIADLAADSPAAPRLREVQRGVDAQVSVSVRPSDPERLILWTDRDAPRGRLCVTTPDALRYEAWRDLVPEDPVAVLEDFAVLDGVELDRPLLLVARMRHAVSELSVHDLATGEYLRGVELPGLGSVSSLRVRPSGGHEAWFTYTDFTTPSTVYRFDAVAGSVEVWAPPPGGVPVTDVVTRQVSYPSADGTEVRMFVISRAGGEPGPAPTILYGYGGFNISLTPAFSAKTVAWVEAGGVYAVANLRGGGEEGEDWHRAGMLGNKQNVFDDFHAAARWLVDNAVTTPARLGISGGSNGGLLVGAAVTQWPESYAAVVCSAPLLDMVRSELFGLGSTWTGEYGTATDPEQFAWLLAWSPYHNVRAAVAYPAVLFSVFESDTRVDPLHARKLAAALQHATVGTRPILLRREREVGHGARAVSRSVTLGADELAFLAAELGLDLV
jgi:prolyl oligopeptidase